MGKNYIEIIIEENQKGNGVVFYGIVSKAGLNAQLVLNALILKSVELNETTFYYNQKQLIDDSQPMTLCKLQTAMKKLVKAGFVTVEKKSENGSSPRNYYTLHNDIIEKAISEKAPELTESK